MFGGWSSGESVEGVTAREKGGGSFLRRALGAPTSVGVFRQEEGMLSIKTQEGKVVGIQGC